ncbi:cobalamin biosynthesis protein CobG, partial [Streptomyces antimicrobicus]
MPPPPSAAPHDAPVVRERGDACPGALRLHAADDGFLARIRIPGGLLTAHQAERLGRAADLFGDGCLELTSRGNVQLRGLADGCGGELAALLDSAGLLPAPGHERIRNVVATPVSDTMAAQVGELDRLLCANDRVTALSGRFLFALDDGRGDVAALGADVTVLAGRDAGPGAGRDARRAHVRLGRAPGAVEVPLAAGPRAAVLAAEYFLDAAAAAGTGAWRVAELPAGHGLREDEFAARLTAAGIPGVVVVPEVDWPYAGPVVPWGPGAGRGGALCVLPPLGRLTSAQWRVLVRAAGPDGELRLTPWRTIVLPRTTAGDAAGDPADALAPLEAAGLVVRPGSPWQSVTSCTGRPGCAKALADVQADARAAVPSAAALAGAALAGTALAGARGPLLAVHFSGCERRSAPARRRTSASCWPA